LATDAVILHSFDPARLANWKARGYPVILMGGFRDYLPYAEANPDAVQRTRDGAPTSVESSFYLDADARTHRGTHPPVPADAGRRRGRRLP
jgi:hypothetical protein